MQNSKDNIDWNHKCWRDRNFSHLERVIRIGTSFSGIGAIEHALKRLGLKTEILFAGDIDPDCKKAYLENYDLASERWHDDIYQFDAKPFKGKVDLFVGGAPCQAFSLRGKRGGFDDTRGTLFREFARVLMECQPKVFIFENVKGMINHDRGQTWDIIRRTFEEDCGYDIHYQILNGRDYGIPQNRERLFCIGFKKKQEFLFPRPIPLETTKYDFLDTWVDDKYILKEKGFKFITSNINRIKRYTQINGDVLLCQKRNQQFNWHGDFVFHPYLGTCESESVLERIFKLSDAEEQYYKSDDIGRYATTAEGFGHRLTPINVDSSLVDSGMFRKLTPRECLRLMGFDESFKIVVSDSATYKQAGNSIIVDVLIALLRQIDITAFGE